MRWSWRRAERQRWSPPARIPDGDTVLVPGQQRWADLLNADDGVLDEPTRPLPVLSPLLTPAAEWRTRNNEPKHAKEQ
jgi:hypothetical protein